MRLTAELGRPPLVEEIAGEVNVTPEGVMEVMKLFLDTNVSSRFHGIADVIPGQLSPDSQG